MNEPEIQPFPVYRQSGLKLNLGLIVCLIGVAAGVAAMLDHSGNKDAFGIGVFLVIAFGALSALYLKQVISPAELHLTPAGLEAKLVLRRAFWTWSEIRNVTLAVDRRVTHIIIHLASGQQHGLTGAWNAPPQEIAANIMAAVRRYSGAGPSPPIVE
jgi:hypothetical protein